MRFFASSRSGETVPQHSGPGNRQHTTGSGYQVLGLWARVGRRGMLNFVWARAVPAKVWLCSCGSLPRTERRPVVVASVEELSLDECLDLLRSGSVGRIAVLDGDTPVALPVNYRLVEVPAMTWIALRTRPGNVIDQAPMKVSFEIDGVDLVRERGWSVVARGTLHHVDVVAADFRERFDPRPWLGEDRSAWLVIQPYTITGRALRPEVSEWVYVGTELFLG
jgi:hypothetical protein